MKASKSAVFSGVLVDQDQGLPIIGRHTGLLIVYTSKTSLFNQPTSCQLHPARPGRPGLDIRVGLFEPLKHGLIDDRIGEKRAVISDFFRVGQFALADGNHGFADCLGSVFGDVIFV